MFLLYFEIRKEASFSYHKPFFTELKSTFPMVDFMDLDNDSEHFLVEYVLKAFSTHEKSIIFFDIQNSDASLNKTIFLLNKLIKKKDDLLIFLNGNHEILEKMTKIFPHFYQNLSEEEIKNIISTQSHQHLNK